MLIVLDYGLCLTVNCSYATNMNSSAILLAHLEHKQVWNSNCVFYTEMYMYLEFIYSICPHFWNKGDLDTTCTEWKHSH